jgi:tetratricopeptide (TPR) repeat protein
VLGLEPGSAEASYNLGIACAATNKDELAVDSFTRAIGLNDRKADYFYNRGITYKKLGQDDKAIADFAKALELDPANADAYNNRGTIYLGRGELQNAMNDFNSAIERNSKHMPAHKNLAAACLSANDPESAGQVLESALRFSPKDPDLLTGMGDTWVARKRVDRGLAFYKKALDRVSTAEQKSRIHARTGLALEASGSPSKALQSYEKALETAEDPTEKQKLMKRIEELRAR